MSVINYHYDRKSGALIGQGPAPLDPLESARTGTSVYREVGFSTQVAPPAAVSGKIAVFDRASKTWSMVEDHRGTTIYDTTTGQESVVSAIGPIPTGKTAATPQSYQTWDSASSAWVDDMPALQADFAASVDSLAEAQRSKYVTAGAAQSMVYIEKASEADAYKAAGYPTDASPYPLLSAEATATGNSAKVVADTVIAARDAANTKLADIEAVRIPAKASIRAASDRTAAQTAHDNAATALAAI